MKVILKSLLVFVLILFVLISYLSIFGIETDRFNNQIANNIKKIDNKVEVELKKIKLILDPFNFKLNIKTVGTNLKIQKKKIEIENIKTKISIKSLLENKFSVQNFEISTKPLEIKNLISFLRTFKNSTELFILEKVIKKGYLIADIKVEFDPEGQIKDNFQIDGFIKDTKIDISNKYNFEKINLNFKYKKDKLFLNDIIFSFNDLSFISQKVSIKKNKNQFLIEGNINHDEFNLNERNLSLLLKPFLPNIEIEKMIFTSNSNFSFEMKNRYKISNFEISSKMLIKEFSIINNLKLKRFFPKMKKTVSLLNNELSIKYQKDNFSINGEGDLSIQDKNDYFTYSINNKKKDLNFETSIKIKENPFIINFLSYEKKPKNTTFINLKGLKDKNNKTLINFFDLEESKNKIEIKNVILNKEFEIIKLDEVYLDYVDAKKQKNVIKFFKDKDRFILKGPFYNAEKLIDNLLFGEDEFKRIFNIDSNIKIDIEKIFLDSENYITNFSGKMVIKDKEILKADLIGNFSKNEKLNFTVNTVGNNKITTFYIDKAEPIVRRYKFIRGFDEGSLDFNSSKFSGQSISQLKIYDFKLKELPVLTKILTLASLQGIADILSGEGIRFNEFEMNFKIKGSLITIEEVYAIGPAISILMDGYIEKNKLVSLRGTLVPATTINKFIGSLPVLGKILVGSKTGEGVFGVSFKIKGHPKKMETSVNPIKTLTPRFITRTLEKIKKN